MLREQGKGTTGSEILLPCISQSVSGGDCLSPIRQCYIPLCPGENDCIRFSGDLTPKWLGPVVCAWNLLSSHLIPPAICHQQFPPTLLQRWALNLSCSCTVFLPAGTTPGPTVIGHQLLKESIFEEQCLRLKQNAQISQAKKHLMQLVRETDGSFPPDRHRGGWVCSTPSRCTLMYSSSCMKLIPIN